MAAPPGEPPNMDVLRRLAHALSLTLALVATPALAQTGTVTGTVTDDTGAALSGAEVRIEGTTLHQSTDDRGRFSLEGVPVGTQTVRALMLGHRSATRTVTVAAGSAVTADLRLERSAIPVSEIEVVVGSRARHTAADELAVPVDVYNREVLARQGSTETSQMLQSLSPAVNFPRQTVTDANDVVRPFTLRGLSPDHTLVLVNGLRRHPTAVVNTFAYGMPAGSSGVDLNALPSAAIDRVEVLRDGASAQYGSDAIAGVVNVVLRRGRFAPWATVTGGEYFTGEYPRDGRTVNVAAGWGLGIGRSSLVLSGEYLDRQPTNRAWADSFETGSTGITDVIGPDGKVIQKRNDAPQPNHHWGDGLERDLLTMAVWNMPLSDRSALWAQGGWSRREGTGNGYRRYAGSARNWDSIYPVGFLPEFNPLVTDVSLAGGWKAEVNDWAMNAGATYGHNGFHYRLRNTLNASLGGSLTQAWPGPDGIPGNADDGPMPNQTSFDAGRLKRDELQLSLDASRTMTLGLPEPVNVALGAAWRTERWRIQQGERASWIDGGAPDQTGGDAVGGSQVFPGFSPQDEVDARRNNIGVYADLETDLTPTLLANTAARFEHYDDFGSLLTGKLALRLQPTRRVTLRAAASTGFRAPGLSQIHFSKVVTNVIGGVPEEVGVFPVASTAARALGAQDLDPETSVNLSAGLAVTPLENLTLTADVYRIEVKDRIVLGATFDDSTTARILSNAGISGVSGVQYFNNGIDTRTVGVDVTADLRVPLSGDRSLSFNAAVNWGENTITQQDGLPSVLATSTDETGILDEVMQVAITRERPDWRATLTTEYQQGPARGLVRVQYFGTFESAQPAATVGYVERYPARTLVDAEAGYRLAGVELSLGARNLFDTYPGKAQLDYNNNFGIFPWAAASPFGYNGRYLYTKLSWTMPR